ncbi:MAG TPA: hypothetical protein VH538_09720 [Gaiellaceae bacterium]|jgi:hypothetical protein
MSKLRSSRRRKGTVAGAGSVLSLVLVSLAFLSSGSAATGAPKNTAAPAIKGNAVAGQTLTADPGTWDGTTPITYAFQWQRCQKDGTCGDVKSATKQSYALTSTDVGNTMKVAVTATNTAGKTTATSAETDTVAAAAQAPRNAAPPSIEGKLTVGQTLTARAGSWTGTAPITYGYQWLRCDQPGNTCTPITGATKPSYTLTTADAGHALRVLVGAKNSGGSLNVNSAPTAVVTGTVNGCPVGVKGALAVANITAPARLLVDQLQFTPSVVTRSTSNVTARFHVSACGAPVHGALVYVTAVPYNQFSVPSEVATDANGWATVTLSRESGFPAARRQQLLALFVRARKPGDSLLGGISTRRLVSTRVDLGD